MNKGNTGESQGAAKYQIDMAKLHPGDIILTGSPGERISGLIRMVTRSNYSHAILVVDSLMAIESADHGVVKFRLDRFGARDAANVLVRRPTAETKARVDLTKLATYVNSLETHEYADLDVVTALFSVVPRVQPHKYFCSQLVCDAYLQGGMELVPGKVPEKVSPVSLATTSTLEDVPNCFKAIEQPAPFTLALLDGPNKPSFHEREVDARQDVFHRILPTFTKHGLQPIDYNSALKELGLAFNQKMPCVAELDQTFATAIVDSGLVHLPEVCFPADSESFFVDFYVRQEIVNRGMPKWAARNLLRFYIQEAQGIEGSNKERDLDVTIAKKAYLATNLETVRLHLAYTWQALLLSNRIGHAIARAIEILTTFVDGKSLSASVGPEGA